MCRDRISAGLFFISLFASSANAATIFTQFPQTIHPEQKYVFYLHGKILEGNTETPVNSNKPQWGVYDFPAIKQALSDDHYNLIAFHRGKYTDPEQYADKLQQDVKTLLSAGVSARNISLVGFSRGGEITILASSKIKNEQINIAILAGCTNILQRNDAIRLYGNILSIYEHSDEIGSCQRLIRRSPGVSQAREIAVSTGLQHGAFFRPYDEWVVPLKLWLVSHAEAK